MTMFSLTEDNKGKSLAIFYGDGETDTIPESHVSFKSIIDLLISGTASDTDIRELTRIMETITRKMSALSERVSVDGKEVYFDGDPLRGEISDLIKKMFEEGKALDFKPLVNFLEKAKTNPSLKSVDDLYRWIKKGDLVIDPDGDIVAYKGVNVNSEGISVSVHSGKAFVNGEEVIGYIPNVPGTVISMPRSNVDDNEAVACSTGLHAGTYSYASSFANRLLLVKINPRDVVSVPRDSSDQKLRVSRYTVLTQIDQRLTTSFYQPELAFDEDEETEEEDYDYVGYDDEDDDDDDACPCGCDSEDEDEDEDEDEPEEDDEESEEEFSGLAEWERELLAGPIVASDSAPEDGYTPSPGFRVLTSWERALLGLPVQVEEIPAVTTAPKSLADDIRLALDAKNGVERDSSGRRVS